MSINDFARRFSRRWSTTSVAATEKRATGAEDVAEIEDPAAALAAKLAKFAPTHPPDSDTESSSAATSRRSSKVSRPSKGSVDSVGARGRNDVQAGLASSIFAFAKEHS